jgi:hypothetical protein
MVTTEMSLTPLAPRSSPALGRRRTLHSARLTPSGATNCWAAIGLTTLRPLAKHAEMYATFYCVASFVIMYHTNFHAQAAVHNETSSNSLRAIIL